MPIVINKPRLCECCLFFLYIFYNRNIIVSLFAVLLQQENERKLRKAQLLRPGRMGHSEHLCFVGINKSEMQQLFVAIGLLGKHSCLACCNRPLYSQWLSLLCIYFWLMNVHSCCKRMNQDLPTPRSLPTLETQITSVIIHPDEGMHVYPCCIQSKYKTG